MDAVSMAIANSSGDVIAFLDEDAVAEEKWVEKYMALFANPRVGGDAVGFCGSDVGEVEGPAFRPLITLAMLLGTGGNSTPRLNS